MNEHFDRSPHTKKAFEVAYAMLRISQSLEPGSVSARLDEFAHDLLEIFTSGSYKQAGFFIEEAGWFIKLWTELEMMPRHLGDSLLLELARLRDAARSISEKGVLPNSLSEIKPNFSGNPFDQAPEKKKENTPTRVVARSEVRMPDSEHPSGSFHYDSSNRQSAIIHFLREKSLPGNPLSICRMKEIQDKFPFVSERTLRYDLQKMVEQGLIERVGAGPMSAYRAVQSGAHESVTQEGLNRYIS